MENRLVRKNDDKVLGGVCSGLAAYFDVDVTVVRIIFILSTVIMHVLNPLIYLALWFIMPEEKSVKSAAPVAPRAMMNDRGPTGEWKFDPYTGQPVESRVEHKTEL